MRFEREEEEEEISNIRNKHGLIDYEKLIKNLVLKRET